MQRYFWIVFTNFLAWALFACAPVTPANQAVTPTSEEFYPLSTRTGIQDIDPILDVVDSGNSQALRSLIQFTNSNCTKAEGLGGPPKCLEGEVEGTPVEVLPFLGPEGHFLRKAEMENWPGISASGLYAIYEVSPSAYSDENYPAGEYAIMLLDKENASAISLQIHNGKIVRIDDIFDTSPDFLKGWLQREASKMILAPLNP